MSDIQICKPHQLNPDECRDLAENLLAKLVNKMGGQYKSRGEAFEYKHTAGVKAVVEPKDEELVINVKLGLMTKGFGAKINQEINRHLDEHLG